MIYLIYFLLVLLGCYYYDFSHKTKYKYLYFYVLFVLLGLLVGLRYYVGADTIVYEILYKDYPTLFNFSSDVLSERNYTSGWIVFMSFCKTLSDSFVLPQLIIAFFSNYILFKIIKDNTNYPFLAILIYFVSMNFTGLNFEFLRQTIAAGIFFFSFKYLINKEYLRYYLIAFLALMFHMSAVITLFFPLIHIFRFNKKRLFVTAGIITIGVIIFKYNYQYILPFVKGFILDEGFTEILRYAQRVQTQDSNIFYFIGRLASFTYIPILVIYCSRTISNKEINLINYKLLVLYFFVSILIILQSEFYRLILYLYPVMLVAVADSAGNIIGRFKQKLVLLILIPFVLNVTSINFWFYSNTPVYKRYIPYESYFSKELTKHRKSKISQFYDTY